MIEVKQLPLYLRTISHIPPSQLAHRVRLRTKREFYHRFPAGLEERWAAKVQTRQLGWPKDFVPIDTATEHLTPQHSAAGRGVLSLHNGSQDVLQDGWHPVDRPQLFRFHLHYMEWAWPLAAEASPEARRDFAALWRSWRAATVAGRWDEWCPYVVSLRAWTLCGVFETLVRDTELEDDIVLHLRASLTYLRRNLELDLHGNHLIKNLKAIVGLATFLGDDKAADTALARLGDEIARQILPDGGHYELSPSYHAQVLADLLDVATLLRSAGGYADVVPMSCLQSMSDWLTTMRYPDGTVPRIGDSTPVPRGLLDEIDLRVPTAVTGSVRHLRESGYVVVRPDDETMAVFDFGKPGPRDSPGHAQADWGTFELWHSGQLLVADPGVSTYSGQRRQTERATRSHNTATVAGRDQTEVWSNFRSGRLHQPGPVKVAADESQTRIDASVTYHGITHRRMVSIETAKLLITDAFIPASPLEQVINLTSDADAVTVEWPPSVQAEVIDSEIAVDFGTLAPARRLSASAISPSSVEINWSTVSHRNLTSSTGGRLLRAAPPGSQPKARQ